MPVFQLLVMFSLGSGPTGMGYYLQVEACQAAAAAYRKAECREVSGDRPIYGTCWGCMHGCTAAENIKICGTDPMPTR